MRKWVFFLVLIMGLSVGVKRAEAGNKPLVTTTFYLWFPSPHNDIPNLNSPTTWIYDPPFMDGSNDESYWKRNLSDMADAGVDGAFLVTYADNKLKSQITTKKDYSHKYVKLAVDTAVKFNIPIKFGAFVDWYDPADGQYWLYPTPLTKEMAFDWFYTNDIKPYFEMIPRDKWLTYGGRPMIMYWNLVDEYSPFWEDHLKQIKAAFKADFGVEPFILMEKETFAKLSNGDHIIDGRYGWNSPLFGIKNDLWHYYDESGTQKDYRVSALGAGGNEQLIRPWRCYPGTNPADYPNAIGRKSRLESFNPNNPDEAGWFRESFGKIEQDKVDMIFIQDFNEMNEGTTWGRSINFPTHDNPIINTCATGYDYQTNRETLDQVRLVYESEDIGRNDPSKYLSQDFYLKAVRSEFVKRWLGDMGCLPAIPPINVKTECSGGKAKVSWGDAGGIVHDYLVRLLINGVKKTFLPEDLPAGQLYTRRSITVDINSGNKISGQILSRNMCGEISAGAGIPDCPNPGDLNHDGEVNIFDYNILLQNFGNTTCGNAADIDGNCKVDIFDYNILVQNFGSP